MSDLSEQIKQLQARLDKMVEYQDYFYREINLIRDEIRKLGTAQAPPGNFAPPEARNNIFTGDNVSVNQPVQPPISLQETAGEPANYQQNNQIGATVQADSGRPVQSSGHRGYQSLGQKTRQPAAGQPQENAENGQKRQSGAEEFIGRNLISLIGIVITIIGVAIGAKYAIDRDLISPQARIVAGYLFALATLGIALRLKAKYHNFSAVLLSGAMAMMYFLTYFAYGFYNLIPQPAAFLSMLLITALTVTAAINYSRQVIAHIGLVGAYAVPFLLSDGSGKITVLFGYMTIVNFGILIVSVKKFWKPLYYSSFIFTWLIFAGWYFTKYTAAEHFSLAFAFLSIFFLTFYLTFVSYKLISDEEFNAEIVVLILVNAFIFYGFGHSILGSEATAVKYLGLFALLNSFIHFFFAATVARYRLGGKINLYLPVALSLTFLTIAFPIQIGGHWLTLLWVAEASFLFVAGRTKKLPVFEIFSYPVMFLASLSLLRDWEHALLADAVVPPFFNTDFLTSAIFAAAFAGLVYINRRKNEEAVTLGRDWQIIVNIVLPTIFLIVLYNTFRVEIGNYFEGEMVRTSIISPGFNEESNVSRLTDNSLSIFNTVWQINYSMLFLTLLSFVNIRKFKSAVLGFINIGLNALLVFVFLTLGLYLLGELRESYLGQIYPGNFNHGIFNIVIRYISYAFAAGLIFANYEYFKQKFLRDVIPDFPFETIFDLGFYTTLLWILSSELLNLAFIFGLSDSYKLALSILWGIYSLALIVLGIFKKKTHLRIGAIILFGLTLFKLFFYDIADLDTISKTVLFVILGILLLIISFLYNKFKDVLFGSSDEAPSS